MLVLVNIFSVCLSLLGTWNGPPESQWQPERSTIQSVLISIQAMILTSDPLRNEPGYENAPAKNLREYNNECQAYTIRYAVLDWLQRPEMRNGPWKDVVSRYFRLRGDKILATANKWVKTNHLIKFFPMDNPTELKSIIKLGRKANLVRDLEHALGKGKSG